MRGLLAALAFGAAFGAATSFSNELASPFEPDSLARVASLVLDAAWAWAALAVAAGLMAGTPARGAAAGAAALLAATTAYYGVDSIVREEPLGWYWPELLTWWLAGVIGGSALGGVGALARRPGLPGLLAGLAVPAAAGVQLLVQPPGAGAASTTPAIIWARVIVASLAAAATVAVVVRFLTDRTALPSARELEDGS